MNRPVPILILFVCFSLMYPACKEQKSQAAEAETTATKESEFPVPAFVAAHKQIMVVTTKDWDGVKGEMRCYEWMGTEWTQVGDRIPIVVGKYGMAWGTGLDWFTASTLQSEGPIKKEGDRKSPAGIYTLTSAFGYAKASDAAFIKLPYIPITESTQCIEDAKSTYYNRIVSDTQDDKDWNSTDHMLRNDDLYEWGIEVAHNYDSPTPGGGSCIFIHIGNPISGHTAGCTAMEKPAIKEVLSWLDPEKSPALVQMPSFAYDQIQSTLSLPSL